MSFLKYINWLRPLKRAEDHLDSLIEQMGKDLDAFEQTMKPLQVEAEAENASVGAELEILAARLEVAQATADNNEINKLDLMSKDMQKRIQVIKAKIEKQEKLKNKFEKRHDLVKVKIEKAQVRLSKWIVIYATVTIVTMILLSAYVGTLGDNKFVNDVHMSYYEALAQIFPVVLIALFVGGINKKADNNRRSTWVLLVRESKFLGLSSVAIGEFASLMAIASQTSNALTLYATTISLGLLCALLFTRVVQGRLS